MNTDMKITYTLYILVCNVHTGMYICMYVCTYVHIFALCSERDALLQEKSLLQSRITELEQNLKHYRDEHGTFRSEVSKEYSGTSIAGLSE